MSRLALISSVSLISLVISLSFLPPLPTVSADSSSVSVTIIIPECNDGLDNDGDLATDYPTDPGCSSLTDNNETDPVVTYQCNDGTDNDGDTRTDYPADLGCDSVTDDTEAGEVTSTPGPTSGGTNGAPGSVSTDVANQTSVVFAGTAPKGTQVIVLADGVLAGETDTTVDGAFLLKLENIHSGTYVFNIYAKNKAGRTTRPLSYALYVGKGLITELRDIHIPDFDTIKPGACPERGDLNSDCAVDLTDFSIASYWWHRPLSVNFAKLEKTLLSGDGEIGIEDFSILAYYWTG